MSPAIIMGLTGNRYRILRKDRGGVKKGAMMLATIETVTDPDTVWAPHCNNADVSAQTTACVFVHNASPKRLAAGKVTAICSIVIGIPPFGTGVKPETGVQIHSAARASLSGSPMTLSMIQFAKLFR